MYIKQYKEFKNSQGFIINDTDYIFSQWDNNKVLSPSQLYKQIRNFYHKYNLADIPPHEFRHSLTNILIEGGFQKKDVAKYMGDTEKTLETYYEDISRETKKKIGEYINEIFNKRYKMITLDIGIIASILNNRFNDSQKLKIYKTLDFITNTKNNSDTLDNALNIARDYIINQNPQFD